MNDHVQEYLVIHQLLLKLLHFAFEMQNYLFSMVVLGCIHERCALHPRLLDVDPIYSLRLAVGFQHMRYCRVIFTCKIVCAVTFW
jgi:hypothetical protein